MLFFCRTQYLIEGGCGQFQVPTTNTGVSFVLQLGFSSASSDAGIYSQNSHHSL